MHRSAILLYALVAILQALAASGAAMLAPFFMKEHGYSIALAGAPLVINGLGRIMSDLLSGVLANFVNSGVLLTAALSLAFVASLLGMAFRETLPFFLTVWMVLGLTEAMFGLSIRKIAFDRSPPEQQGRSQGQVAAALGIGFTLGPVIGGWVGARWGADRLFLLYALPHAVALSLILVAGSSGTGGSAVQGRPVVWREGKRLLARPSFVATCLGIFQAFLFLGGVTRIAFPFLAVSQRGLSLNLVGTMVGISRLADTVGRMVGGWISDKGGVRHAILGGVLITVPMFVFQVYGHGFLTLLIPLCIMTLGFGFTNVGGVTSALQMSSGTARGVGLGLARASNSAGSAIGPLVAGVLIQRFQYEGGFFAMGLVSLGIFFGVWYGFHVDRTGAA